MSASPDMFLVEQPAPVVRQSVSFIVYGNAATQGIVGLTKAGRGILIDDNKRNKSWREDVRLTALTMRDGQPPMDGPLRARMVFTVRKPASAPKTRRTWPDKKPDVSKLCRSVEDAIVSAGLIVDDARIVGYSRLEKCFPGEDPEALDAPGVRITIERIV